MISTLFIRDFLICFQMITALFGTFYYFKYKKTNLKYLIYIIWYDTLNEFFALFYSKIINENNLVLYNIHQIVLTSFYLILYKNVVQRHNHKRILVVLLIVYCSSVFANCFLDNFISDYFALTDVIGSCFVVIGVSMYFIEVLTSDKIIYINKSLLFWLSIALLIYLVPTIPFTVVTKYYRNSPTIPYIYNIIYGLVFLMNLLLISGFICSYKEQKD